MSYTHLVLGSNPSPPTKYITKGVRILDNPIGKVSHYYSKIGVAIIDLQDGSLKVGQQIKFIKGDNEFTQQIESLQIEHQPVKEVKKGDSFGLKISQAVEEGTLVYLV
jgi:translation initiation factor IF-2